MCSPKSVTALLHVGLHGKFVDVQRLKNDRVAERHSIGSLTQDSRLYVEHVIRRSYGGAFRIFHVASSLESLKSDLGAEYLRVFFEDL